MFEEWVYAAVVLRSQGSLFLTGAREPKQAMEARGLRPTTYLVQLGSRGWTPVPRGEMSRGGEIRVHSSHPEWTLPRSTALTFQPLSAKVVPALSSAQLLINPICNDNNTTITQP